MTMLAVVFAWLGTTSPAALADPAPPAPTCEPAVCATIDGRIRGAGLREPLAGAHVVALPTERDRGGAPRWRIATTTAADGRFVLPGLPPGPVRIVVVAPGHARFERIEAPTAGRRLELRYFVMPESESPYRTVVRGRSDRGESTRHELAREELEVLPGSQGDALRALQNLPGMARAPGGLGLLVMRGASPNDSQVFFGEHPVPRAFHVTALSAVVPTGALSKVEYVPSNFDAAYGNATGGLVILRPRVIERTRPHGFAKVDLLGVAGLVHGRVGRGTFLLGAQRSYFDAGIAAAERLTGERFLSPTYWDYQGFYERPLGQGTLTVRVLGSGDRLTDHKRNAFGGDQLDFRSDFHRVDLVYRARFGAWDVLLTPSFRVDVGSMDSYQGAHYRRNDYVGSFRAQLDRRLRGGSVFMLGTDGQVDGFAADRVPSSIGAQSGEAAVHDRDVQTTLGAWAVVLARLGALTIRPGVRGNVYTLGAQKVGSFDPRLNLRADPGRRWFVHASIGQYSRMSVRGDQQYSSALEYLAGSSWDPVDLPPVFALFDPGLMLAPTSGIASVRKALATAYGIGHRFGPALTVESTVFWRREDPGTRLVPYVVDWPGSTVDTWGVEAMLRKELTRKLFGWVAYTFMRSSFSMPGPPPLSFPYDFEQRHNLVALFGYRLPRRWQIGARFRITTGFPYTPIVGAVDVGGLSQRPGIGAGRPIFGETNSARYPVFHQLDFRIDKSWVKKRVIVHAYLDIQNVYNHRNVEALMYSRNYRTVKNTLGLPIFPTLGVRIDY